MSERLVIIPTYNEKENIGNMVHSIMALDPAFDLLVVDDGSPDGTGNIIKDLQKEFAGRLHLLERSGKQGLGTAYITGFKWGLDKGYEYLFEMDADFSHKPADLVRLYESCSTGGADVTIGSRYVKGGGTVNWPWDRIFLSKGGSLYARMVTWMPVRDTTAGFICYRRKVLETIDLDKIRFLGYAFQIEMKYTAWKLGFKVREVPIIFEDRMYGISKMSGGIIKEGIIGVLRLRFSRSSQYRRK